MLVDDLLRDASQRTPRAQALVCGGQRLTFAELHAEVDGVAHGLVQLGLSRGGRVIVSLENSVEAVLAICGTLRAGGVIVPVNPTTKSDKLEYLIRDSEPVVVIADARAAQTISCAMEKIALKPAVVMTGRLERSAWRFASELVSFEQLREPTGDARSLNRGIDIDVAALIYTSGSTGGPKGAMLSHRNILFRHDFNQCVPEEHSRGRHSRRAAALVRLRVVPTVSRASGRRQSRARKFRLCIRR